MKLRVGKKYRFVNLESLADEHLRKQLMKYAGKDMTVERYQVPTSTYSFMSFHFSIGEGLEQERYGISITEEVVKNYMEIVNEYPKVGEIWNAPQSTRELLTFFQGMDFVRFVGVRQFVILNFYIEHKLVGDIRTVTIGNFDGDIKSFPILPETFNLLDRVQSPSIDISRQQRDFEYHLSQVKFRENMLKRDWACQLEQSKEKIAFSVDSVTITVSNEKERLNAIKLLESLKYER